MKTKSCIATRSQRQRFSLRKYRVGLASVLLGTALFAVQTVQADELTGGGAVSLPLANFATPAFSSEKGEEAEQLASEGVSSLGLNPDDELLPNLEMDLEKVDAEESNVSGDKTSNLVTTSQSASESKLEPVSLLSSPPHKDNGAPKIATRSAVSESSDSTTDENEVETESQARIKYYQELKDLKLKRIEIPYGFTKIDDDAFTDAEWVEEVVIPETVERIGNHAFKGTSLKKIELPKGLKYLGHESFSNIQTLEEAFLPNTLVEDYNYYWNYYNNGSNAFANNTNLKKLTIEPGLTFIPSGLASGTGLTRVDIPDSVEIIRRDAFANAEKLSEVNLSAGLKEIHHQAFQNTAITSITLPKSLTIIGESSFANTPLTAIDLPEGLNSIDSGAFSGTKLQEVVLPKSLSRVETGFSDISTLTKIRIQSDLAATRYSDSIHFWGSPLTEVNLSEGVTTIPRRIFANQKGITALTFPSTLREIGELAFAQSGLKAVVLPEGLIEVGSEAFAGIENLTTVSIPASLERADSAFRDSSNLKTVNFAPGTRKIADGLLSGTAFKEFTIPEGIEELGNRAFANNYKLTKVTLPSTLRHFGEAVFADTSLKTIIFPRNMTTIPRGILANTAVEQVVIPEGVVEIEDNAFANIPSLKSVTLPASLKKIGDAAFYNTGLERIQLPEGLTEIGHSAFSATKLREVHLPNSVEVIGHSAFSNNSELTAVTLSTTLKEIPDYAFSGTSLTQIAIPASVTKVGDSTFSGADKLEKVDFSTGLKEIGSYAFSGTSLRDIKLPSGLETIGGQAFGIETLSSIFIPKSLREGGVVYYKSGALAGAPGSLKVSFESGTERIADNLFAGSKIKTLSLPSTIREIGSGAFAYSDLSKISLPESLRIIGDSAFSESELTEITLPDSVATVGHHAFSDTYQLKQAKLSENLAVISDSLFANSALESMLIPEKVSEIGHSAFYNTKLKRVSIPASVVNIGSGAFSNTPLSSLTLTDGLVEIGREAFTQTDLGELVLPDTVTTLGARAFASAGITKLTLSKNLVRANDGDYYEWGAFANNPDLTEVHIPKALENGRYMFAGNRKLSKVTFEDGRTEIPAGLLAETGLIELTLPETIERIGGNAFASNPQLTTWKPHEGLKEIGSYAFSNSGLKELSLPDGLTYLGDYAFADSSKLNHLTINKSLETISTAAFSGASINRLNIPSNIKTISSGAFQRNDLKELIFEEGVEDIASSAFSDNDLTKLTLPDSLKALGSGAFANNYELGVLYLGTGLQEEHRYGYSYSDNYSSSPFKQDNDGTFRQPSNLFVTVKEGTTHIPAGLFKNAEQVIYVKIPDTVTSIGAKAFEGTSLGANFNRKETVVDKPLDPDNLLTVTLPDSITHLGESSFGNIKTLTNINIPKHLVEADMAFKGSRALVRLRSEIPGTRIPDGILQETGVNTFIVPPTVTEIGKYAFLGNKQVLGNNGQSVSHKGLENVVFSPDLKKIDTRALENTSVTFLDIPNGVTEIKEGAFRFNEKLASVKLPKELTRLEGYLFEGNALMTKVIVPSKVEHVDVNAFVNMPNLEVVYLPSSVRHIDDNLVFNPEKTIFHVEAGSYAETYMKDRGLKHQVVPASDYARYSDGIVIEDKTRFVTTSQALKQSGYLALELDYALDTNGRTISDKEIRITLPKGSIDFLNDKGQPKDSFYESKLEISPNFKAEVTDNVLYLKNVSDSGKVIFYVKTDSQELARLNIAAQVIYKEYGIQKSETLAVISEDMPFLTISTNSTISDKKVIVSGKTVPNAKIKFDIIEPFLAGLGISHDDGRYLLNTDTSEGLDLGIEVVAKADGTYRAELPVDFSILLRQNKHNNLESGDSFRIRATAQVDGIRVRKVSDTITYQDNAPRLKSFVMKHGGRSIDLTDGKPNEVITFYPNQYFTFEVHLENDDDVDEVIVKTTRNGSTAEMNLRKFVEGVWLKSDSYFAGVSKDFVPGEFEVIAKRIYNKDSDGDGLITKLNEETEKLLKLQGLYHQFVELPERDNVWDVSDRDMALFSSLAYMGREQLQKLFPRFGSSISEKFNFDDLNEDGSPKHQLYNLDVSDTDKQFFGEWKFIEQLENFYREEKGWVDFVSALALPTHITVDKMMSMGLKSSVSYFLNKKNSDLVIAFRGTDEGGLNFFMIPNYYFLTI